MWQHVEPNWSNSFSLLVVLNVVVIYCFFKLGSLVFKSAWRIASPEHR
jgi:hypothetical protein